MDSKDEIKIGTICYHTNNDYTKYVQYVVYNVCDGLAYCVSTDGKMFTVGTSKLNTTIEKAYEYSNKFLRQELKNAKHEITLAEKTVKTLEKFLKNLEGAETDG